MSFINPSKVISCSAFGLLFGATACMAAPQTDDQLQALVKTTVTPVMQQQNIAGLAVAVTVDGKAHYFNYGIATKAPGNR